MFIDVIIKKHYTSVLMIAPFINFVTTSAFDKEDTNSVRVFSNVS